VVAISPIIGGATVKGPADRMLTELGMDASAVGVARLYAPIAGTLVIDDADAALAGAVEAEGLRCIVTDTIMSKPGVGPALARTCLSAAAPSHR
jgi:LPPG:FO 2-phospho-L-lactate transferase